MLLKAAHIDPSCTTLKDVAIVSEG